MSVQLREADAPAIAPPTPRPRRSNLRLALFVGIPISVLAAVLLGYATYRDGVLYVSTDNAQLTGQPVQVGSANAGRVVTLSVRLGGQVHRGDVLAQVALPWPGGGR